MNSDNKRIDPPYLISGREIRDGAGVRITRLFGSQGTFNITDPFLLLDFFGSKNPEEYLMGFPWHPHRGIETLTYLVNGKVEHEDSIGNRGELLPGEIQWMTAGSGIFHQEMPKPLGSNPEMMGFQLWINLPRKNKLSKPKYRHINVTKLRNVRYEGNDVKVISGSFLGSLNEGAEEHPLGITYLDITSSGSTIAFEKHSGFTSLVIPMEGELVANDIAIKPGETGIFSGDGNSIIVRGNKTFRFIYISGAKTRESIAWYGPVVMNTWDEIEKAFKDLQNGTFVRDANPEFVSY
ncbi:MAG: pirin family protein [Thermoplasmata archaeon]